jgi:hypothetical protein
MSCNTNCKNVTAAIQYLDAANNPTPFYTEPDTGLRVLGGTKCGMHLVTPCGYKRNDVEYCLLMENGGCPDWCDVATSIKQISRNTYPVGGPVTPVVTVPVGYANDAAAITAGLTVGMFYYNTTTGMNDVVC